MAFNAGTAVGYLMLDTSGFTSGFASAKKDLKVFQSDTASTADKFAAVGSSMMASGKALTLGVTAPLVGIGAASVKVAADFESSMSQVYATMRLTADSTVEMSYGIISGAEAMEMLEAAAKEAGATTAFSATEAGDALNYLALAGFGVEDQIAALPIVLDLAAAGNMDLAYASDLVTDSMSVLNLSIEDMAMFTDQMAATASNANTSVAQLGEAVLVAGGQASICNLSTADLNTSLGILANNGIKGSEGGTMLRNVLKNLYTPTDKAAAVMEEYGLVTQNADGSLREFEDVLTDVNIIMSQMSEAERVKFMSEIFDTRTIAGANALLKGTTNELIDLSDGLTMGQKAVQQMEQELANSSYAFEDFGHSVGEAFNYIQAMGPEAALSTFTDVWGMTMEQAQATIDSYNRSLDAASQATYESVDDMATEWDKLHDAIEDSEGAAKEMAEIQLDNLSGAFTKLKSATEGAMLAIGDVFVPVIRKFAEFLQKLVNGFNNLSPGMKQFIVILGTVAAAIGPVLLVVGKLVSSFGMITKTVTSIIGGFGKFLAFLGPGGFIVIGIMAIVTAFVVLWNKSETFRNFFITLWEAIKLAFQGVVDFFSNAVTSIVEFFTNLKNDIQAAIDAVVTFFQELPGRVWTWLVDTITRIATWIEDMKTRMREGASNAINTVVTFFSELPGKVYAWLVNTIAKVTQWAGEMLVKAKQAGSDFVDGVINFIKDLPGKIQEWMQQAIDYLSSIDLLDIGRAIMQSFYDGLKEIWDGLWTWLSGIGSKVASAFSAGSAAASSGASNIRASAGGGPGARVKGSYASGLDYVPRDMLVKVHQGESIRTKNQTSRDLSASGGDTFNFYSPTALTPIKAAQEMKKAKQQLALGFR